MKELNPFKIFLSIIDPEYQANIGPIELSPNKNNLINSIMKLAKDNGLYYYFIQKITQLGIEIPSSEEDWNIQNKKLVSFKKTLKLLADISASYGIDYILIKRYSKVPHIPRDIDIFIHRQQREKIIKLLEDRNMQCVQSGVTETSLKGNDYIGIDIYTEITYISFNFIDNSYLWNSKTKVKIFGDKYWGLSKEADFLLTLVHNLIGHRRLTLLDFLHLKILKRQIDLEACKTYAYNKGWLPLFNLTLNKLNLLEKEIYENGATVDFPYLFDRKFILKCISSIDELNLSQLKRLFLHISLIQDAIIHKIKRTLFYELLSSSEFIRHLTNSLTASVKKMRGDKKAV